MSYVFLDLEWNGSYSKTLHKFVNEIIEFGAIKTDDELNIIDTFSVLISPKIGKKLCSKVKELTKITNEDLINYGIDFMEAIRRFKLFSENEIIVTWSTSDIHALVENYRFYTNDIHLPFLSKYCNLQKYCEDALDLQATSNQLGLSACAELLNIDFSEDEHHRAFADAELSLKCLKKTKSKLNISSYVQDVENNDFYEKMLFKTHFITDINSPDIDKKQLSFVCSECNNTAVQTSKWRLHNKSFVADFNCKNCSKNYLGRISFKKKYDGIIVKKKLTEKNPKQKSSVSTSGKGNSQPTRVDSL